MPLCGIQPLVYPSSYCPSIYMFTQIEQQGPDAVLKVTVMAANVVPFQSTFDVNVSYSQYALAYPPGQPQSGNLIPDQYSGAIVPIPAGVTSYIFYVGLHPNLNTQRLSNGKYRLSYRGIINFPCNGKGEWNIVAAEYQP